MTTADVSERAWSEESVSATEDFDRWYRDHYRMVYRTAYGVLGHAHDAEDVAQTVFLRLSDDRSRRRVGPNPEGYLYRAAVNQSLNVVRARQRSGQLAAAAQREWTRTSGPSTTDDSDEDRHRRLYHAVARLSARAAEILILKYVHNCSHEEIARRLGTSRAAVAVSVFRSRARLLRMMRRVGRGGKS